MAEELTRKKVDESWKERVEQERQQPAPPAAPAAVGPLEGPAVAAPPKGKGGGVAPKAGAEPERAQAGQEPGMPEARFDIFISGLAVEALVAMGDMPHPATRRQEVDLPHARYMIDLLGVFEEKTKGNLSVDEDRLLKDTLYQLRMRYLNKTGGA